MRKPVVLITGANGEIGHALITRLAESGGRPIVALDEAPLDGSLIPRVHQAITGSVLDRGLLDRMLSEYEVEQVFHLAALLSSRAEITPVMAHRVNVDGTLNLLEFAQHEGESHGRPVRFLFPSSIAIYGLPLPSSAAGGGDTPVDSVARSAVPRDAIPRDTIKEDEWNTPITMYGCNKLYGEHLGRYYARRYKQLGARGPSSHVDFRAVRFPGLISAVTVPSGGTSDYVPEMAHAAARGEPYACFVRPDTRIPFMAMPDGIDALLRLASVARETLTRIAYNLSGFNPSAEEMRQRILQAFPGAEIDYRIDSRRQQIVDSWPDSVDDGAARRDWGFRAGYDLERTCDEYLFPTLRARYR